jgi:hypothetical protein
MVDRATYVSKGNQIDPIAEMRGAPAIEKWSTQAQAAYGGPDPFTSTADRTYGSAIRDVQDAQLKYDTESNSAYPSYNKEATHDSHVSNPFQKYYSMDGRNEPDDLALMLYQSQVWAFSFRAKRWGKSKVIRV